MEDITARYLSRRTLERRLAALTRIAAASLDVDRPTEATLDTLAAGVARPPRRWPARST